MFAKLFELDNGNQVLAYLDSDVSESGKDIYPLRIRTLFDNEFIEIAASFEDEESARNALEKYTKESAMKFFGSIEDGSIFENF